jgi:hypothetical protein
MVWCLWRVVSCLPAGAQTSISRFLSLAAVTRRRSRVLLAYVCVDRVGAWGEIPARRQPVERVPRPAVSAGSAQPAQHGRQDWRRAGLNGTQRLESVPAIKRHAALAAGFEIGCHTGAVAELESVSK